MSQGNVRDRLVQALDDKTLRALTEYLTSRVEETVIEFSASAQRAIFDASVRDNALICRGRQDAFESILKDLKHTSEREGKKCQIL